VADEADGGDSGRVQQRLVGGEDERGEEEPGRE
jgi:hypothetical protein